MRAGVQAVKEGKFQQLQRELNALRRTWKKNGLASEVATNTCMRILRKYPLNGNGNGDTRPEVDPRILLSYDEPTIIISETFA